jgi:hypothetical protein
MHVSRAPPPRHSLTYLHFLAKKYHPEMAEPEPEPEITEATINGGSANGSTVNGGDDPMGGDDGADVEMGALEPPVKRQRTGLQEERYISASERIREALSAVDVGVV